nr:MAG: replication associated protein [Cressdnaviricota sp.]
MTQPQLETLERLDLGNTITKSPPKQSSQLKKWCFTWNNYTENDFKGLIEKLDGLESKYVIGREIGAEGTPHLQGYIELPKAMRWSEFNLSKKIHWEGAKGNQEQNIKYCTKDDQYETNMIIKLPLEILKESELYEWEKKIINIIKQKPDRRTIYWFWEEKGNIGKTTFCKYLSVKYGAVCLGGKNNDILYCAAQFETNVYLMNIVRARENYVSYESIEQIKDGYYMCAKYESKPIVRNCPHFIIFANFKPEEEMLSADRWKISIL